MRDDQFDDVPARRPATGANSQSGVKVVVIVLAAVGLLGLCMVGGVVALIVYGVREAKKSIVVMQQAMAQQESRFRYEQVATAMQAYHTKHGHFPLPAMKTKSGKRGLSWRVAILPELGEEELYKQFKLDESWDSADNMRLASRMPDPFMPPDSYVDQRTHLRLFVGNGAMFEFDKKTISGRKPGADEIGVGDGLPDTIMFVEAAQNVLWIQPDELMFDPKGPLPALGFTSKDYFFLATADGQVKPMPKTMNAINLKAAITANGGETFTWD